MTFLDVFFLYICPTVGSVLSTMMFAAPVADLRLALCRGYVGHLDTVPFVFCAGNTLGWIIYGHLQQDPFLVAANLPGFIVSLWLNYGAAKLQYHQLQVQARQNRARHATTQRQAQEHWDASNEDDEDEPLGITTSTSSVPHDDGTHLDPELFVMVPQEAQFLRMMVAWATLATYAAWFVDRAFACTIVGWAVNICLVFFYGAPLHTIRTVVATRDSTPIHRPTLSMSLVNTSFWMLYGLARHNMVIVAPNATGFCLAMAQGILCLLFPSKLQQQQQQATVVATSSLHENGPTMSTIDAMTPQPLAQEVDDFE